MINKALIRDVLEAMDLKDNEEHLLTKDAVEIKMMEKIDSIPSILSKGGLYVENIIYILNQEIKVLQLYFDQIGDERFRRKHEEEYISKRNKLIINKK